MDTEHPIRHSRAQSIMAGQWYFGAGQIVGRLNDVTFEQLTDVFGNPHVEKSGDAFGQPRRFFWSLWDNVEEVRLVIASDSRDERAATRWKVGAYDKQSRAIVRKIASELFAPECIEYVYDPWNASHN